MKSNGHILAQESFIQVNYTGVLFLRKVLFSSQIYLLSIDQTSHKRDLHWIFVKGHKVD